MKYYKKRICILAVGLSSALLISSCKTRNSYNPYLTAKEKPSDKQRKEEKKQIEIGTQAYKKQMLKNKKDIRGNIQKATSSKKHYKYLKNRKKKHYSQKT
jgi:hypothetical protein